MTARKDMAQDQGAKPRLARRVALACIGADVPQAAAALLLDDFAEALGAYARYGGIAAPEVRHVDAASLPEMLRGWEPDALVLGIGGPTATGLPVGLPSVAAYALVAPDGDASPEAALDAAGELCRDAGLAWRGGVAVAHAGLARRLVGQPRMGTFRRPVSETVDELVLAVRCGANAGRTVASPALPRLARLLFGAGDAG